MTPTTTATHSPYLEVVKVETVGQAIAPGGPTFTLAIHHERITPDRVGGEAFMWYALMRQNDRVRGAAGRTCISSHANIDRVRDIAAALMAGEHPLLLGPVTDEECVMVVEGRWYDCVEPSDTEVDAILARLLADDDPNL